MGPEIGTVKSCLQLFATCRAACGDSDARPEQKISQIQQVRVAATDRQGQKFARLELRTGLRQQCEGAFCRRQLQTAFPNIEQLSRTQRAHGNQVAGSVKVGSPGSTTA